MAGVNRSMDLNREARGLPPAERLAVLKAYRHHTIDEVRELIMFFGKVKKQAQVFQWLVNGEAVVESFSAEYEIIKLKTEDGRSHKVVLF